MKERIIEVNGEYLFDTKAGLYIRIPEEIVFIINSPSSDFQDEGERWEAVSDLLDDHLKLLPYTLEVEKGNK